jgi:erythronate-4-phosphate dehydrogenase
MKILADAYIAKAREAFSGLGELQLYQDQPTRQQLLWAEALLVRTTTRVDAELLAGTPISYVASATSGADHIDREYLVANDITFYHAGGCNAGAVADYVLSVLALYSSQTGKALSELSVGVVGCGRVGGRVRQRVEALGCRCLVNDPPLAERTARAGFVDLTLLLTQSDLVTLHVPLQDAGRYPTFNLIGDKALALIAPGSCLINASRGGVVDEESLLQRIRTGPQLKAVLDCWANEPEISAQVAADVWLGTPHIAGYSRRGKLQATAMVYEDLCRRAKLRSRWSFDERELSGRARLTIERDIRQLILSCYDVRKDNESLRAALAWGQDQGSRFKALRNNYALRAEFTDLQVEVARQDATLWQQIAAAGFRPVAAGLAEQ